MTVGELIERLQQFDLELPVKMRDTEFGNQFVVDVDAWPINDTWEVVVDW